MAAAFACFLFLLFQASVQPHRSLSSPSACLSRRSRDADGVRSGRVSTWDVVPARNSARMSRATPHPIRFGARVDTAPLLPCGMHCSTRAPFNGVQRAKGGPGRLGWPGVLPQERLDGGRGSRCSATDAHRAAFGVTLFAGATVRLIVIVGTRRLGGRRRLAPTQWTRGQSNGCHVRSSAK